MRGIKKELRAIRRLLSRLLKTSGQSPKKRISNAWMEPEEVIETLNISARTLQTWRDNGMLPYTQIGGIIRYKTSDIENLLNENYSAK